jgi:hypothetical protein
MKYPIHAIAGAVLLATVGTARPAHSAPLCDQYDRVPVAGTYLVQNNHWNGNFPGDQCITVIEQGPGFKITRQTGHAQPLDKGPLSYPSLYIGCHYTSCSPGTNLPMKVDAIKTAPTSIDLTYVDDAIFDASYDIWLDPTDNNPKVNKQEIMIWLDKRGEIQPVGDRVAVVTIAGHDWQVWSGSNGQNAVLSYEVKCVAPACRVITSMSFDVMDFIADASKRVDIKGFYLTSIQAGFEPWQGGQGLAIERFRAAVEPR